jgi:isopenicillin-N epimerase
MNNLRELFLLRDDVVFLNHGSFGACPKPVFDEFQHWQLELEEQPVLFLGRRFGGLMYDARAALAGFVGADPDDVVYIPNTTTGVNLVARSLALEPGDEVLSTNLEYGAAERSWQWICRARGARFVRQPVPLPIESRDAVVDAVWSGWTERTRVLFLSHITSTTALILPVEQLIERARDAGVISIIDGAHAPGQIPVDMEAIGADFYTANCHKWLMAPKGAAFLYARRDRQELLDPLIVSWGNLSQADSRFVQENEWQGTRDVAAYLSVPAAIRFREEHNWPEVQDCCFDLLVSARRDLERVTGLPALCPPDRNWIRQMASQPIPVRRGEELQKILYKNYRVEIPVVEHNGEFYIRVSIQGYNTQADVDALVIALTELLPDFRV